MMSINVPGCCHLPDLVDRGGRNGPPDMIVLGSQTDAYAKCWGYPISDEGAVPAEATLPEGKYLIIGLYRNRYGIYSTPPCFFAVKK